MYSLLFSCEHAGHQFSDKYAHLFSGCSEIIESHRGWDIGAKEIGKFLTDKLKAPFFKHEITRLLVEANRSLHHSELFSSFSKELSDKEKNEILDCYYFPYRYEVENELRKMEKPVAHFSIHTFTPVLDNKVRQVDVGILFDENRVEETNFCIQLKNVLSSKLLAYTILFNEPYKGTDDGFTTYLRKQFPGSQYLGIEIEVNQKFVNTQAQAEIQQALLESIIEINLL